MFWSEDDEMQAVQSNVIELVFLIEGKTLPINTLSAIAQALGEQISNWDELQIIGLHLKLGGEEGNGWYRDENPDSILYISRRTKLVLRIPEDQLDSLNALSDIELNVVGHSIKLKHKHNKPLKHSSTLYSHHVISDFDDELEFLSHVQQYLKDLNINCKKILCGKSRQLDLATGKVSTRSLMLNELNKEDSLLLQAKGIGNQQKRGCGVFVPYKTIS